MTTQIVGYSNGQYIEGEVEVIHKTDRVEITRWGAACYGLRIDNDSEMLHYTSEAEARRHAALWTGEATAEITKRIQFDRTTKDYNVYIAFDGADEQYIGSAATYGQAEIVANDFAINFYIDTHTPEAAAALVLRRTM